MKCFACDRPLNKIKQTVWTLDGQSVEVGADCYEKVSKGFKEGYQPPKGGPRLYTHIVYLWLRRTKHR